MLNPHDLRHGAAGQEFQHVKPIWSPRLQADDKAF